ncbi:MAG: hypothetical protein H6627_06925 [Calditrichae bacterium]|nr:hypothetical protein [Calditrichota bacterium]MCB9058281.1 hypothetical protein [Calditrichia bacterium]
MNKDKLNELLSMKAKSPAPKLHADPFMVTRIEALAKEKSKPLPDTGGLLANWSLASVLAAGAVILGIYLGNGLSSSSAVNETSTEILTEYSQAFYQSGFVEDWHNVFEDGDTQ